MSSPVTRNLTILLTDIKGFTDKTSHKSRSEIQELLDQHRQIVLPILESKGGRLVKTIGDAFLMSFESPTDAVLAGVAVQEALAAYNKGRPAGDRIEVRIAINSGEVNLAEGDVFGEPVNITARIEGVAEAGEVFFTEAVYLSMNKKEVPSSEVGLLQLKGIPEKVRVYKVKREQPVGKMEPRSEAPAQRAGEPDPAPGTFAPQSAPALWRRALALGVDALLCLTLVGVFYHQPAPRSHRHGTVRASKDGVRLDRVHAEGKEISGTIGKGGLDITIGPSEGAADGQSSAFDEEETRSGPTKRRLLSWPFALAWVFYNVYFLRRLCATPGMRILKLRLASAAGSTPDKKQILWRSAFSLLSGYAFFLGFLWIIFERDGRGWHDLIAGTRVLPAD